MCFSTPRQAATPPVPSKNAEEASARRAEVAMQARQARGREATIITSPLGDPGFGQDVRRTRLAGF
jgi:hypothetical protein